MSLLISSAKCDNTWTASKHMKCGSPTPPTPNRRLPCDSYVSHWVSEISVRNLERHFYQAACVTRPLHGQINFYSFLEVFTSFWITLYRENFYFVDRSHGYERHGDRCTTGCGAHKNSADESAWLTADAGRNEVVTNSQITGVENAIDIFRN
jgi:hypothetical protein